MIDEIIRLITDIFFTVLHYLKFDWLVLLIGILMSVSIKVYLNPEKLRGLMIRKSGLSIPGAVAFGALTPLCACGTTAIILSMFVSSMPWGAVMAFLISSPLTSPSQYMFQTAFFGTQFANGVFVASIILGLSSGFLANFLETKTKFFHNQYRMEDAATASGCCTSKTNAKKTSSSCCSKKKTESTDAIAEILEEYNSSNNYTNKDEETDIIADILKEHDDNSKNKGKSSSCCSTKATTQDEPVIVENSFIKKYKLDTFLRTFFKVGIGKVLKNFIIFIAIGRIIEIIMPREWVSFAFGSNNSFSVILSATLGLPLYISGNAALPLLKSIVNSGASAGAVMAFLIAGKATGVNIIIGLSLFLKKKALFYYVSYIYLGAIITGYLYEFFIHL